MTWSRIHTSCVKCETTSIPHRGRGLCDRCHREATEDIRVESKRYESIEDVEDELAPMPQCLTPDKVEDVSSIQKVNIIVGAAAGWSLDEISNEVGLSGRTVAEVIELYDFEIRTMSTVEDYRKPVYRLRLLQRLGVKA